MDRRREVRQFLTSRRARLSPEAAGVTVRGHERRVPGLRREEVAVLAGVSLDYYIRLERGNLNGASDNVLDALSHALRLNDAERLYLHELAHGGARDGDTGDVEAVAASLQRLLDAIAVPAFIRNRRLDYLAASADFRERWESGDVRLSQAGSPKRFCHPVLGELRVTIDSMQVHTRGDLTFWSATAEPGSPSEAALARLLSS